MGRHKKGRPAAFTPLAAHRKEGSTLRGPLGFANPEEIDWPRDQLPEFLWLAALAARVGLDDLPRVYNTFMDALDAHWPHAFVALGLISDFGLLTESERASFLATNRALVEDLFHGPIGRALYLYPEGPASWLVSRERIDAEGHVDPFTELAHLRGLVLKLGPGKGAFAGRIRAIPLNRLLKHNKIYFRSDLPVVDLFPRYPTGLTEDEQRHVEAVARQALNMALRERRTPDPRAWPRYFWRHNFDLTPCRIEKYRLVGGSDISPEEAAKLGRTLGENSAAARAYLDLLALRLRPDLYDPLRDEVLFGLFARVTRLYALIMEEPALWARDTGGLALRSQAESAITFAYLAQVGTPQDFKRFVEYGEGQQKLLMLHLQDNHPEKTSLEGLSPKELAEDFDIWPEILDIELGHWAKKNARKLARDAGMEDVYRLVFAPASGDVHGSWVSLKHSNLLRCIEPLHRWHRMPTYAEPPFFVNTAIAAQDIYVRCRDIAIRALSYPAHEQELQDLGSGLEPESAGVKAGEPADADSWQT